MRRLDSQHDAQEAVSLIWTSDHGTNFCDNPRRVIGKPDDAIVRFTKSREAQKEEFQKTLAVAGIMESREFTGPGSEGKTLEELQWMVVEMFRSLPPDEYPNMISMVSEDVSEIDEDTQFLYGLERLLDGLEADLLQSARAG